MNIAIVHYHLNRGGVTQVITNHLHSLAARTAADGHRIAVFFGGRKQGWPESIAQDLPNIELSLHCVSGLDYDEDNATPQPRQLAAALQNAFVEAGLTPENSVIHFHNHNLGKNVSVPGAVLELAREGYRLLLQIHDFAEDFRPQNYRRLVESLEGGGNDRLPAQLYSQARQIHYAVLNRRDLDILAAAGVASDRLHLLPNPVFDLGELPGRPLCREKLSAAFGISRDARLLLYPVRGIRRKNVGEALLWSLLAGDAVQVGLTLAPINPVEQRVYHRWRDLARRLSLPCTFGLGEAGGLGFKENLAAADAILTTSVAEGFGMVFAEAWLAGRMLVGRDLPDITRDFVDAGLRLDGLRPRVDVPLAAVQEGKLRDALISVYQRVIQEYGCPPRTRTQLEEIAGQTMMDGTVDFAKLPSTLQRLVLEKASHESEVRNQIIELNPWIDEVMRIRDQSREMLIGHNAAIVRSAYSLFACGQRLADLYGRVAASGHTAPHAPERGGAVLEAFLDLPRLCPIRIEE